MAVLFEPAFATARREGSQSCSPLPVRHRSPQRELGDWDVAHQLAQPGSEGWQAGRLLFPQSPGSRPGLV